MPQLAQLTLMPLGDSRGLGDLLGQLAQLPRPREQAPALALLALRASGHAARWPHDLAVQRDQCRPTPAPEQPARGRQVLHDERVVQGQFHRRANLRVERDEVGRKPDHSR